MNVLTYHNNPALKAEHIAIAERHLAADILVAGTYAVDVAGTFKGCSVGCFAHEIDPERGDYHAVVAEAAGWPEWLVRLSDPMFEGLPAGEREQFHVELRRRIPVGVDLTPVMHAIAVARMDRLLADKIVQSDSAVVAAINGVRALHEGQAAWSARSAARLAAESAARSARSAARLAARLAAWSAAWSAAELAESAAELAARLAARSARSAARLAARLAAESAAWIAERDALYAALEASA